MKLPRKNFEFKVIFILLIVFTLVFVTGVVTYNRFSTIVNGITTASRPDLRLVKIRTLENDLTQLGNLVKTYTLTKDDAYLERFVKTASQVEEQLNSLDKMNKGAIEKINIAKLDSLISEKFFVLNELLYSQNQFRVQDALTKVMDNIEQTTIENTNERKIVAEETTEEKPKRKLLGWIKRKKESKKEASEEEDIAPDVALIEVKDVTKEIQSIRNEELNIENSLKDSELNLITRDYELSLEISTFIDDFDVMEREKIKKAVKNAESDASTTNTQIAIFCFAVGVLLIFMAYLIVNYVKKNNEYKIALKRSQLEAEKLAKTRERFLANMSHEIRTPMNSISGFADQLHESQLDVKQRDYVTMIRKSTEHLMYLINDVLDFTKLQNGKLKLESIPFNIIELAEEVTVFIQQQALEKEVIVKCSIAKNVPKMVIGDAHRIRQVLLNLMSNSVKFTDQGKVELELSVTRNNELSLLVKDTGIGMDEDTLKRVFDEFEQADASTARNYGGTGLGLSISKMLVEMMGGTLLLTSKIHHGTTAEVLIALQTAEHLQDAELISFPNALKFNSILVVDDEEFNRKLLGTILKKHKIKFELASDGREAMEFIEKADFELILMDARMPNLNGLETTKAIRNLENARKRNVKIIVLTAAISEDELNDFKSVGISGVISKPFKEADLFQQINLVYSGNNEEFEVKNEFASIETDSVTSSMINFSNLQDISRGDELFYKDMLETFLQSSNNGVGLIKVGLENEDWELIANEAHKISSPCKHIGAFELYSQLTTIEKTARSSKSTDGLAHLIQALSQELQAVNQLITDELQKLD